MTEDERMQATILIAVFNKVSVDYTLAVACLTLFKKQHGKIPHDAKDIFDTLKDRMLNVLEAMKKLRAKIEAQTPIDQLIVPDCLPEEL